MHFFLDWIKTVMLMSRNQWGVSVGVYKVSISCQLFRGAIEVVVAS